MADPGVAETPTAEGDWLSAEQYQNWRAFIDGSARLDEALAQDLEKTSQLTLSEYAVLVRLSEVPRRTIRMSQLADDLSHSRSRMTHTVRRLETRGYVRRSSCDADGRGVNCAMTKVGHAALVAAAPAHVAAVRRFLIDVVTPEELEILGTLMTRVATACEAGPEGA